jgi:hypothetical protein
MSKISLASKIAIAFIRPFRSYLDGYALIKNRRGNMEENMKIRMDDIIEEYKTIYPDADLKKMDLRRDFYYEVSKMILDRYEKSYDEILPKLIDSLTVSIENNLKSKFTEEELMEIEKIVSNPIMLKLLNDKDVFGLLKDCELKMDYEIQMQLLGSMMGSENSLKIQEIISELQNKYDFNKDNTQYEDFYEDEDDEDLWNDEK